MHLHLLPTVRLALLAILVMLAVALPAQQDPKARALDSLRQLLAQQPEDTHKVTLHVLVADKLLDDDPNQAVEQAQAGLAIAQKLGFKRGEADCHHMVASARYDQQSYEATLDALLKALSLYEELGLREKVAHAYNFMGNVHADNYNIAKATEYLLKSRDIFLHELHQPQDAIIATNNIATLHIDEGKYEQALAMFEENLKFIHQEKVDHKALLAATHNNIGECMRLLGRCNEALPYLKQAEALKLELNDQRGIGNTYCNIGYCMIETGDLDQAELYLHKGLDAALAAGRLSQLEISYKFLSRLEQRRGHSGKALEYALQCLAIKDSVITLEQAERVERMHASYEAHELEKMTEKNAEVLARNELLEKTSRLRLGITIALMALAILLVGLVVVLLLSSKARTRRNQEIKEKSLKIAEQTLLLSQSNTSLRQQNDRLEELMREKDGLISVVAHDLKAPLARSAGLAQLIGMGGGLSPDQEKYLGMIHKVTDQGKHLISDLLSLHSLQHMESELEMGPVALAQLCTEMVESYSGEAGRKGISLRTQGTDVPVQITSDKACIARLMDNLLSNAVKFSPAGSTVTLSLSTQPGHAQFTIQDQGPGFTEDDRRKLFQKFQRLSARPTGGESSTGLGLAITKALVDKLHGTIEVISEAGKGAAFVVRLPIDGHKGVMSARP